MAEKEVYPTFPNDNAFTAKGNTSLTKREEFAKAALQGLCANPEYYKVSNQALPEWVAHKSIEMADALIAELNKPQP